MSITNATLASGGLLLSFSDGCELFIPEHVLRGLVANSEAEIISPGLNLIDPLAESA